MDENSQLAKTIVDSDDEEMAIDEVVAVNRSAPRGRRVTRAVAAREYDAAQRKRSAAMQAADARRQPDYEGLRLLSAAASSFAAPSFAEPSFRSRPRPTYDSDYDEEEAVYLQERSARPTLAERSSLAARPTLAERSSLASGPTLVPSDLALTAGLSSLPGGSALPERPVLPSRPALGAAISLAAAPNLPLYNIDYEMPTNPTASLKLLVKLAEMLFVLSDEIGASVIRPDQLGESIYSFGDSFLGVSVLRNIDNLNSLAPKFLPQKAGFSFSKNYATKDTPYFNAKHLKTRSALVEDLSLSKKVAKLVFVKRDSMPGVIMIRFSHDILESIRYDQYLIPHYEQVTSYIELECLLRSSPILRPILSASPMPCEEILNPPQLRVKPVVSRGE
jgi:hypothetical protein